MSVACAVHCGLMPFVAGLLPLIGFGFLAGDTAEVSLLLIAAGIALSSVAGGCRHHGRPAPLAMVASGFALILTGRLWLTSNELFETILVTSGALAVASAHLLNWRMCCSAQAEGAGRPRAGRAEPRATD